MLEEIIGKVPKSTIHEHNTGAIFMVKNSQIGECTKHIDTRHHYVKQQVENGTVEVVYINTLENPADIMTKIVKEVLHKKFSPQIFEEILCMATNKEDVMEHVPAMLGIGSALALALAVHERQAIPPSNTWNDRKVFLAIKAPAIGTSINMPNATCITTKWVAIPTAIVNGLHA